MKKSLIQIMSAKMRANNLVRISVVTFAFVVVIGFGGYGFNQYRLSKIDCAQVTKELSESLTKKQYAPGVRIIKQNDPACFKDVSKLKNNKERVISHEYNAISAKVALKEGDKNLAKSHIRKSIDSVRAIDVTKSTPEQLKSYSTGIELSTDDVFMLDYEINKRADGSYEGYYGN